MSAWRGDEGKTREYALLRTNGTTAYHQSVPFSQRIVDSRTDKDSSLTGEVVSRIISFSKWRPSSKRSH